MTEIPKHILHTERNAVRYTNRGDLGLRVRDLLRNPRVRTIPPATGERRDTLLKQITKDINYSRTVDFNDFVNNMAGLYGGTEPRRPFVRAIKSLFYNPEHSSNLDEVLTTKPIDVPCLGGTVIFRAMETFIPFRNEVEIRIPNRDHDAVVKLFYSHTSWSGGLNSERNLPNKRFRHGGDNVQSGEIFYTTLPGASIKNGQEGIPIEIKQKELIQALAGEMLGIRKQSSNRNGQIIDSSMAIKNLRDKMISQSQREA